MCMCVCCRRECPPRGGCTGLPTDCSSVLRNCSQVFSAVPRGPPCSGAGHGRVLLRRGPLWTQESCEQHTNISTASYTVVQVPDTAEEGEAEISSKEEEFQAICQLHGVLVSAPLALQLKAVEAEYHSLREAGQTHKAEHVQSLHAWKSKKALQVQKFN